MNRRQILLNDTSHTKRKKIETTSIEWKKFIAAAAVEIGSHMLSAVGAHDCEYVVLLQEHLNKETSIHMYISM